MVFQLHFISFSIIIVRPNDFSIFVYKKGMRNIVNPHGLSELFVAVQDDFVIPRDTVDVRRYTTYGSRIIYANGVNGNAIFGLPICIIFGVVV